MSAKEIELLDTATDPVLLVAEIELLDEVA